MLSQVMLLLLALALQASLHPFMLRNLSKGVTPSSFVFMQEVGASRGEGHAHATTYCHTHRKLTRLPTHLLTRLFI